MFIDHTDQTAFADIAEHSEKTTFQTISENIREHKSIFEMDTLDLT